MLATFTSSLSDFIMQYLFSNIMFYKIKISLLQLCYDHTVIIMLEYQIITFKKSLK